MESQMQRRNYDEHLHHVGEHIDEAQTVNESPVVRSGLAEPTVMGMPVLAEDLYATHSDIVDTPVRSFAQWKDEERRGAPPPLSTAYETHLTDLPHGDHHIYGGEGNREQFKGSIGKHTFLEEEEDAPPPILTGYANLTDEPLRVGGYAYDQDVNTEQLEGGMGHFGGLEEERYGVPQPPPSTGVLGTRMTDFAQVGGNADEDIGREERVGMGKSTRMEEDMIIPKPTMGDSRDNLHSTDTGGNEVGITEVLHSLNKMKVFDEHDTKSLESDKHEAHEPKVYTGSHDQFAPEPIQNPPLDTIAANPSNPNSSYTQRISSATSAIADKASAVKDSIVSKLSSSGQNKGDDSTMSHNTNAKASLPSVTALSHKVADTLSSTLGPVYEKVASAGSSGTSHDESVGSPKTKGVSMKDKVADTLSSTLGPVYEKVAAAGSSVTSKMQGPGHDESVASPKKKGVTVKEYLADTFKPGEDDKVLSDVITHAFHRGKGNRPPQETSTTYEVEVTRDEGERRLQESSN